MQKNKYEMWIEKYRSTKLDDIVGQDKVIKRLKEYVKQGNFPNLMFSGPPGCGKTSTALVLSKEIFKDKWYGNFKELNASDSRGIDTVRNEIKKYANTQPLGDFEFKVIFLDECDALTSDAQAALRRTMEIYSSTCKFILSCNYSSKIIEPIQSRCAVYRFRGISPKDIASRMLYIAEKEKLEISESALEAIVYVAEGDLRKAIGILEVASLLGNKIEEENVYKSSGLVHPKIIRELLEISLKGNFKSAMYGIDILRIEEGLASVDILKQMFKEIMTLNIDDKRKIDIIDKIGETDFRISEGADEEIGLKSLIAQLIKIGK